MSYKVFSCDDYRYTIQQCSLNISLNNKKTINHQKILINFLCIELFWPSQLKVILTTVQNVNCFRQLCSSTVCFVRVSLSFFSWVGSGVQRRTYGGGSIGANIGDFGGSAEWWRKRCGGAAPQCTEASAPTLTLLVGAQCWYTYYFLSHMSYLAFRF